MKQRGRRRGGWGGGEESDRKRDGRGEGVRESRYTGRQTEETEIEIGKQTADAGKFQTHKMLKTTLFIMTKHSMPILGDN